MPRKLLIAVLLSGCASVPDVTPPAVQVRQCPAIAPSLPCTVGQQQPPTTLQELHIRWLTAEKNSEDCKALADTWLSWWTDCVGGDNAKP